MIQLTVLSLALAVGGCTVSRTGSQWVPLCNDQQRDHLLSQIHEADEFLANGDSTRAWWEYVGAVAWFGAGCRDRMQELGEFGRALAFAADHAEFYQRDTLYRRGHSGTIDIHVDGVRLDSHVVRLHRVVLPAVLADAQ